MLTCTFFGHKDAPKEIEPMLSSTIVELIENKNVFNFYVGNHGNFDYMVKRCLIELKNFYHINYAVVMAYLPGKKYYSDDESFIDTIIPNGIETVPRKFAINYRNKWMIEQSDYVVTYVNRNIGGAAWFKELAERKKKTIINIAVQNMMRT